MKTSIKKPDFWNSEPAGQRNTLAMVALCSGDIKLYSDASSITPCRTLAFTTWREKAWRREVLTRIIWVHITGSFCVCCFVSLSLSLSMYVSSLYPTFSTTTEAIELLVKTEGSALLNHNCAGVTDWNLLETYFHIFNYNKFWIIII